MPRKNVFTKDMLIEAAFRILRESGLEKLSARTLARELQCSTMPVYSYLKSMKTLVFDLEAKAIDLMLKYQATPRTGQPFFDMGLGYVIFSRNEKNVFRFLSTRALPESRHHRSRRRHSISNRDAITYAFAPIESDPQSKLQKESFAVLVARMRLDPTLAGLDDQQLEAILTKMWIFAHGLAFLINSNSLIDSDDESIQQLMWETGFYIIEGERNLSKTISKEVPNEGSGT
jgi:AcrR family transcriptional regulator